MTEKQNPLARLGAAMRPKAVAIAGSSLAVVISVLLFAMPGGLPDTGGDRAEPQEALALSGKDLYSALSADMPAVAEQSRVSEPPERGSRTNRVVLPETSWEDLSDDQRISLGSWLNSLGGDWEIRVGTLADDGSRVRAARPTITSAVWNQQLK